jgi:hypothetical protein
MTSSNSTKKKNINEKEIIDFFYAIEERFHDDEPKIKEIIEIINNENNTK